MIAYCERVGRPATTVSRKTAQRRKEGQNLTVQSLPLSSGPLCVTLIPPFAKSQWQHVWVIPPYCGGVCMIARPLVDTTCAVAPLPIALPPSVNMADNSPWTPPPAPWPSYNASFPLNQPTAATYLHWFVAHFVIQCDNHVQMPISYPRWPSLCDYGNKK